MKMLPARYLIVGLLLLGTIPTVTAQTTQVPQIHAEKKAARKEIRKEREAWIEQMHRAAPGTNWRDMDQEIRREKLEQRLRFQGLGKTGAVDGTALQGTWSERGSNNLAGRIHTVDVDFQTGTIYAASAGGIVWRGMLNGQNWVSLNDNFRVQDPRFIKFLRRGNTERLLIMGGDSQALLLFTDDNGQTWHRATGLDSIEPYGRLLRGVATADGTLYVLATQWDFQRSSITTVYRSTDAGTSFQQVYSSPVFSGHADLWTSGLGDPSVYFLHGDSLSRFSPSGTFEAISTTFQRYGSLLGEIERTLLQGRVSGGEIHLYALLRHITGHSVIYRSLDSGGTWHKVSQLDNFGPFDSHSFAVSRTNDSRVFTGGINLLSSTDEGTTFGVVNEWYEYYQDPVTKLHADIPCIHFFDTPQNDELMLICTDGGLYTSHDYAQTRRNISLNGMGISQYYSILTTTADPHRIHAGSQDQGYQWSEPAAEGVLNFSQIISGDYGHLSSSNGGETVWSVYPGFALLVDDKLGIRASRDFPQAESRLWMPPLMADPADPYAAFMSGGTTNRETYLWHLTFQNGQMVERPLDFNFGSPNKDTYISAIAVSPLDASYRYLLTDDGRFFYSADAGQTWTRSKAFTRLTSHYFYGSTILPSPVELGRVTIAGSGYSNPPVFSSTDHGETFTRMDAGLPSTLVFDLAATPDERYLFAATEVGPYVYDVALQNWFDMSGSGAPDQTYWAVEYVEAIQAVRFATYGRGIWDFHGNFDTTAPQAPLLAAPLDGATNVPVSHAILEWSVSDHATTYHYEVAKDEAFSILARSETVTDSTVSLSVDPGTTYYWRVRASNTVGTSDWSPTWRFTTETARITGTLTFHVDMSREMRLGHLPPGQTVGLRGDTAPLSWTATMPLTDSDGDGIFSGPVDFTLVPATSVAYQFVHHKSDGRDLIWEYGTQSSGHRTLTFNGDAVQSIAYWNDVTGVAIEDDESVPGTFALHPNYPNPFNPLTTIAFTLPATEHVTLQVFDALGHKVATLADGRYEAGHHTVLFEARHLPSGVYLYRLEAGPYMRHRSLVVLK